MVSSLEELAFEEAKRAISQQQASLEAMRTRVVAVVSAAAVSTGLLNQGAFTRRDVDGWAVAALVCLGAIGLLAAFVLYPRPWVFSNDVRQLVADTAAAEAEEHERMFRQRLLDWAWYMAEQWDENDEKIRRMSKAYKLATLLLVVLTILWVGRILG